MRDGRIVAVGTDAVVADLIGTSTEVVDLGGRMLVPGFQDAHVHPVSSGIEMLQCDLNELASPDAYVGADRGVRGGRARRAVDPRRRMGHGRVPRRLPVEGGARRRGAGPAGLPAEPRRPQRVGQLEGPRARRHHARHSRPRGRPDRTGRGGRADGHAARRGDDLVAALVPPPSSDLVRRGLLQRAGVPACPRHHRLAGRDRRGRAGGGRGRVRRVRRCRPLGRPHGPGRRRALVGSARAGSSRSTISSRSASAAPTGRFARDVGEDHAGRRLRELHRRRPGALPGRGRAPHREPRDLVRGSRAPEGRRDAPGRAGVPGALPRHRGAGGPGGPRRRRGGADRERDERHASPRGPHPGGPPRRPPTVPPAPGRRERPAPVGGPRAPDGRPHDPVPRGTAVDVAVPLREPRPSRRDPRDGERLVGLDPRPARRRSTSP